MSMLRNLPFAGDYPISLSFGDRPDLFGRLSHRGVALLGHPGLDFDLPLHTPVLAVQHGVVLDVRNDPDGYGDAVVLGHRWGQTFYGHLAKVDVEKGRQIGAGQQLGLSGDSGVTDRPILHFGLRVIPFSQDDGWCGFTDPKPYLKRLTQPRGAVIGPHIINSVRPHLDALSRWKPRLITILDPHPDDMLALRDVCPESVVVGRIFVPDHEVNERIRANPVAAAQWAHELTLQRRADGVDYWQIANEVLQEQSQLPLLNTFELERMQLAQRAGYRCAIMGFSVGNPDLPEHDRMAAWRLVYPALEFAERNGHVVALHQYGMPDLWGPNNAYDWYIYRLEHQVLRRLPFRRLKFAVTEYGIDGMIRGDQPAGWQTFTTPEGYVEQLLKCARYVERFSGQILGYSIFTLGHHHPWQTYDIAGKTVAYLADLSEKGTWREIDAQVYDIAPRETDAGTDPGPTLIDGLLPDEPEPVIELPEDSPSQDDLTLAAEPSRLLEQPLDRSQAPTLADDTVVLQAAEEHPEPPTAEPFAAEEAAPPRKSRRKSKRATQAAEPTQEPMDEPQEPLSEDGVDDLSSTSLATRDEPLALPNLDREAPAWALTEFVDDDSTHTPEVVLLPDPSPVALTEDAAVQEIAATTAPVAHADEASDQPAADEAPREEPVTPPDRDPARPLVDQRIVVAFAAYNMAIKDIRQRPDEPLAPSGAAADTDVVYLVKDIFMTYYGSWEPKPDYESVPEWARADYLRPEFLEAGADHHLFAAVIGLDGQFIKNHEIVYWSDGFERLGDPTYNNYVRERTKESSGWANLFMAGGSSFVPQRGETGPWCWAPAGAAEVVVGGGLPIGHPVSTFVVWQAVPRALWEATLETETPVAPPSPPEEEPGPAPTPDPSHTVTRRISDWVTHYNVSIKPIAQRPDRPQSNVVYIVKDIFTTRNGSWEPDNQPGSLPQWARDAYLKPLGAEDYFDDAGGDHHLFAAVIGLDGKLVRGQQILYWSDGFEQLANPDYQGYVRRFTKERSGWANIITGPGSSFVPERGESGPWCWAPAGAAEVVCGGGLPANHHISFFVVWQAVALDAGETPDVDFDHQIFIPTLPAAAPTALPGGVPLPEAEAGHLTALRQAAWIRLGIEYPTESTLANYARRNHLGAPMTQEFVVNGYRVQGFQGGIVYASVTEVQRVGHTPW